MTVINAGSIAGGNATSGRGINLRVGGTVTNQSGGMISGYYGVVAGNGALTVVNAGSIAGNTATHGIGVSLNIGGNATNQSGGLISGYTGIFGGSGGALTILNGAVIAGNSTARFGEGVQLRAASTVTNQNGGTISGYTGIYGLNSGVTIVNAGSITGDRTRRFGRGVYLEAGGSLNNQSNASITGHYAVVGSGGASTIVNTGTIAGDITAGANSGVGVDLVSGGRVTNQTGGSISGFTGVLGGSGGALTVVNAGSIAGNETAQFGEGIQLAGAGRVTNQSGGVISAYIGIFGATASTVVNDGSIVGSTTASFGIGVRLDEGGSVTNQSGGAISGYFGLYSFVAATIMNAGSFAGNAVSGTGINLGAGGSVTNQSGAMISGWDGIGGGGSGALTVVNAGTVSGSSYAVRFAAGQDDLLTVDPGAVFNGTVDGGNAVGAANVSTLELATGASAGTLFGLGTKYINFAQVTVDAGANWTLTGYNTIATGDTLTNSGSLTISSVGTLSGSGLVDGPLENDGQIIANGGTLDIDGDATGTGQLQVDTNSTLELEGAVAQGETVNFSGIGPGTLILDDPEDFQGAITGLTTGDTIDLANVTPASVQLVVNSSDISGGVGGTLTAYFVGSSDNMSTDQTVPLAVAGNLDYLSPVLTSDGAGGTNVVFEPTGLVQIATVTYSNINGGILDGIGSGLVIGPHSILTAAHVVWSASQDQSATSITIAPYGSSEASVISGTLQPFIGPPTTYNSPESSLGTIGSITGVYFYAVNDPSGVIEPGSFSSDLAVIDTSQNLTQYVQLTSSFAANMVDFIGQQGGFADGQSYSAESGVNVSGGLLNYQSGGFIPNPNDTTSPVAVGMSGGPALVATANGLQDVGVISTTTDAVQLTGADIDTIQTWEALNGSMLCYAAGTHILMEHGQAAVEHLLIGDLVWTVLGQRKVPIIWIGHRYIDCVRHPNPNKVWPVRISADALGPGLPHRDLFLSPDHAVFADDVLIPIKHLINGTTITQVPVDSVTYYHIELDRHDVLLAEGLPAESYLDTGNRCKFSNCGGAITLHPDFSSHSPDTIAIWEAFGCAPLIVTGPRLNAARRLLNSIASAMPQVAKHRVSAA